jgi:stage III sporulation protein AA
MPQAQARWKDVIGRALPVTLRERLLSLPAETMENLEEIRVGQERPVMLYLGRQGYFLKESGGLSAEFSEGVVRVTAAEVRQVLDMVSEHSLYAMEDELRNGFISLRGGCRVGIAGRAVLENGRIKTFKHINAFNFRIARPVPGAADKVMPHVRKGRRVCHTLILSPPQMGKTTLVRDMVQKISDGHDGYPGLKVGLIDERSEIAGMHQGVPSFDIGMRTDVLDACPKAEGIILMIRSLSPQVVVTDEIGRQEDVEAIEEALNTGVDVIVTAHAKNLEEALKRPVLLRALKKDLFERIVVLGDSLGAGTLERIYEGRKFHSLWDTPVR